MPYIDKKIRDDISIHGISEVYTPGELNFFITDSILEYLETRKAVIPSFGSIPSSKKPNCYADYNEVIGVLECVKLELYRKVISKYEDKKEKKNGTVYP